MSDKTENKLERDTASDGADCSVTLAASIKMIEQQEYLLKRQEELMSAALRVNGALVSAANEYETKNAKLRKELKLYERRKAWGFLAMFIPPIEIK